jgi:hypothetical protein
MDAGELERAKTLEIRAMVKTKNDSMRQSRALKALGRRTQAPAAKYGETPVDEKNHVTPRTGQKSLEPSGNAQEELDIEMLGSFLDQWQLEYCLEHVISRQLHFYSFGPEHDMHDAQREWLREFWMQPGPLASAALSLIKSYGYIEAHKSIKRYDVIIRFLESCVMTLREDGLSEEKITDCLNNIVQIVLGLLYVSIPRFQKPDIVF